MSKYGTVYIDPKNENRWVAFDITGRPFWVPASDVESGNYTVIKDEAQYLQAKARKSAWFEQQREASKPAWQRNAARKAKEKESAESPQPNGQYAIRMPGAQSVVVLPDGRQVSFYEAMKAGYEITDARHMALRLGYIEGALNQTAAEIEQNLSAATRTQKGMAFAAAIMNLPEAQERPNAAAMVATSYADTWSIERAQSFLRGLPREMANDAGTASAERPQVYAFDTAKLRRKVELRAAALATHTSEESRREMKDLRYAFSLVDMGGMSIVSALETVGIDPTQFSE